MRKAKIKGCVAETVGTEMTDAAIGVGFKVGRYERYAHVVFPIEKSNHPQVGRLLFSFGKPKQQKP